MSKKKETAPAPAEKPVLAEKPALTFEHNEDTLAELSNGKEGDEDE